MCGPFVHTIDPIFATVGGVHLWWYGATYLFGFLAAHLWMRALREEIGYSVREVYAATIMLALGVLVGARLIEVAFYEWPYYRDNLRHIPAVWLGGMSTPGILLGAVIAIVTFSRLFAKPLMPLADTLAIAGALIMGLGRLGNFIDGQISGSLTNVCWGVKFPDLDGFRHPVVLYDGLKNLLLIPLLLFIRSRRPPAGVVFGHFIGWYGFLRIFVDFFREYRVEFAGLPPGQGFNIVMTVAGLAIVMWAYRAARKSDATVRVAPRPPVLQPASWPQRIVFVLLLLFPLVIPSDWTQDVPERYGHRHLGLEHSALYPKITRADDGS